MRLLLLATLGSVALLAQEAVELRWLENSPAAAASFGVPWPRGAVKQAPSLVLDGTHPVQSWPLAYWPDGSLKWTGHAVSLRTPAAGPFRLTAGSTPASAALARQSADAIDIDTGALRARIALHGRSFLESLSIGSQTMARNAGLLALVRDDEFTIDPELVSLEQNGAVRAVVKVQGRLRSPASRRALLPFVLRLYFYAGQPTVRVVHSLVYDGEQDKDFIRGLALVFDVPLREQLQNRHVRFATDDGVWAEPVRQVPGVMRVRGQGLVRRAADQASGTRVPNVEELEDVSRRAVESVAVWDRFKLVQSTPDGYGIAKRTNPQSAWLASTYGRRAPGSVFVGDVSGGLAVGVKDFWQRFPAGFEITDASTAAAQLRVWLWTPDAPAMDLRHYDTVGHPLDVVYEDYEPGLATPYGIAHTTELLLGAFSSTASHAAFREFAASAARPPHLVLRPERYHAAQVFGVWSLPDRSTNAKRWIEEQLDASFAFYRDEVDKRRWYGFWNYGDVMHSYDTQRRTWRYDTGGYAWANTELVPDMWLWYSFLRSGRADIFRMAEAMTRHTSETDVYHLGPLAGLGSRHNVSHWGDGAKEARISMAGLKRFYYYLTTDERTGDLMREVVNADRALLRLNPMRKILPKPDYPTHARSGPDWLAFASNWMTEWERTGEPRFRDKILTGMKALAAMPQRLFSGPAFGYDPSDGMLYDIGGEFRSSYHMITLFGGAETAFELRTLLDEPAFWRAWDEYCEFFSATPRDKIEHFGRNFSSGGSGASYARLAAWAAHVKKDKPLAARAWSELLRTGPGNIYPLRPNEAGEIAGVSTNTVSQWCLNAIQLLALIPDDIPLRQ